MSVAHPHLLLSKKKKLGEYTTGHSWEIEIYGGPTHLMGELGKLLELDTDNFGDREKGGMGEAAAVPRAHTARHLEWAGGSVAAGSGHLSQQRRWKVKVCGVVSTRETKNLCYSTTFWK